MKDADKEKDFQQDLEKLIESGKKKGFLTYDEVNDTLSSTIESSEDIDQVFEILDGKGIRVVDTSEEEAVEGDTHYRVLFLIGVVLFAMTFIINMIADLIVKGFRTEKDN